MAVEKNDFALYDGGGDLTKNWFVYFYRDKKRVRVYGKINREKTVEARNLAAEMLIEELRGRTPPASFTDREKIQQLLGEHRSRLRKKTFQTYKSKIDVFFEWLKNKPLVADQVGAFFKHLLATSSPATYNDYRLVLFRYFNQVSRSDLVIDIAPEKENPQPARYFQPFQRKRIKAYLIEHDPLTWLHCQFIYYCFIRPGELRLMKVGDIFFEERRIMVRGEISKNKKTQYVAIPHAFLPDVVKLMQRGSNEWLFPSPGDPGRPVSVNYYAKRHRRALNALGFDLSYQLYSWKHTGAVCCVKAGVHIKDLQIQLRHASLEEVDLYLRQLGVQDLKNLAEKFPPL